MITGLQELLSASTKPLPDIPSLATDLDNSETEIVERRKNILDSLLGIIGNDRVWNLLFYASATHFGDEALETALLRFSRIEMPESTILVADFEGRWLTLIKSDKGAEWGKFFDEHFRVKQAASKGLGFSRAPEPWMSHLLRDGKSFEKILASLAGRFEEATRIPAEMEGLAGDKAVAISENRKEIDMLTNLACFLEATIYPLR